MSLHEERRQIWRRGQASFFYISTWYSQLLYLDSSQSSMAANNISWETY